MLLAERAKEYLAIHYADPTDNRFLPDVMADFAIQITAERDIKRDAKVAKLDERVRAMQLDAMRRQTCPECGCGI